MYIIFPLLFIFKKFYLFIHYFWLCWVFIAGQAFP